MSCGAENDKRTTEQKAIDEWLPITSSRKAKWWYSAFHNVTAMVGAGVLSLPYAMSELGWGPGVAILILSWVITLYTLWQMVEMHEMVFIMMFAAVHFVLSHLPNFNSISAVSLAAAVMSLVYSTIAWVASAEKGVQPNVSYAPRSTSTSGIIFDFFSALGNVAFAYAGHNVVLEIQATMPSTPEKPSKIPMWKGVVMAYIVVAICYFPVALRGYYVFGNSVDDNILMTLQKPAWLIATANLFVFIHIIGGCQIFAMPVFDMLETVLVKKLKFKPTTMLRFVTRNLFVVFTMFIGIMLPFFGGLLGFIGGFAFAPTSYYIPCIMWLKLMKPKKFSLSWCANWICIVFGILLTIIAPIGGLRELILSAKNYRLFS